MHLLPPLLREGVEGAEGDRVYLGTDPASLAELGFYWTDVLHRFDRNGSGTISRSEFLDYVLAAEQLDESGDFVDKAHATHLEQEILAMWAQRPQHATMQPLRLSPRTSG